MEFITSLTGVLEKYGPSYLRGAGFTLILALVGTVLGCIIGFAVGVLQTIPVNPNDSKLKRFLLTVMNSLLRIYVEVFRGTPMIVQAVFIFYGLRYAGVNIQLWPAAVIIVSINTGAYMAETVRGGILSIDPGQTEGCKSIGMTHFQTMLYVIMPQTLRNIIPQIGNNFIINIKDTSVLSIISFPDLFYYHKTVAGNTYRYFESACIVMVIYLTMTLISSYLLRWWERKLDGPDTFDLATKDTLAYTTGTYNYPGKGSNYDERNPEAQQIAQEARHREKQNKTQSSRGGR